MYARGAKRHSPLLAFVLTSNGICRAALALGSDLDRSVSEAGVLQLLFDVRFLRNALAGGSLPVTPGTGTQNGPDAAAIQDRRKSFAAFEAALQVCQT